MSTEKSKRWVDRCFNDVTLYGDGPFWKRALGALVSVIVACAAILFVLFVEDSYHRCRELIRRWLWVVYPLVVGALMVLWWFRRPEAPWDWLTLGALWFAMFLAYPGVIRATEDSNRDSLYYRAKNRLRHRRDEIRWAFQAPLPAPLEDAVEGAVMGIYPIRKPDHLWVETEVEGFPDYCYAVVYNGLDPVVGGPAFVVEKDTLTVHEVSGSVPPHVNCQTVADRNNS